MDLPLDWTLEQPGWLAGLALLGLVAWWLRSPSRPSVRPTSTLAIWRELSASGEQANIEHASRLPRAARLALLGLGAGLLALAGPVRLDRQPEIPRRLVLSMHPAVHAALPDFVAERGAGWGEFDEVVLGDGTPQPFEGVDLLVSRLRESVPGPSASGWAAYDRPGSVFVLHREPREPTEFARWYVPERAARPGWVAHGTWFDGERLERREGPLATGTLSVSTEGQGLSLIADFARTYAGVRGLDWVVGEASEPRLRLSTFDSERNEARRCTSGGVDFLLAPRPRSAAGQSSRAPVIVRDQTGAPAVRSAPGRIAFASAAWEAPGEDPARVALALAALFDGALGPPPGVEPVGDRRAQLFEAGQGNEPAQPSPPPVESRLPAVLFSALAGWLLLASAWAGRRSAVVRS